jgi:hypothetical protein
MLHALSNHRLSSLALALALAFGSTLAAGCSSSSSGPVDDGTCGAGKALGYAAPSCGTTAAPTCVPVADAACVAVFCGCDGVTFSSPCGAAEKPYSKEGVCSGGSGDAGPDTTPQPDATPDSASDTGSATDGASDTGSATDGASDTGSATDGASDTGSAADGATSTDAASDGAEGG